MFGAAVGAIPKEELHPTGSIVFAVANDYFSVTNWAWVGGAGQSGWEWVQM